MESSAWSSRPQWCRVTELAPQSTGRAGSDSDVTALADRVRRQFEILREVRGWTRGLENGDEVDLDAFVESVADRRSHGMRSSRLYRRRENRERDLAVAVALDMSRSTAAWIGEHRVDGAHCVGLTIDRRGRSWLPHLFGPGHYSVFSRPDALPEALPRLYARITGLGD